MYRAHTTFDPSRAALDWDTITAPVAGGPTNERPWGFQIVSLDPPEGVDPDGGDSGSDESGDEKLPDDKAYVYLHTGQATLSEGREMLANRRDVVLAAHPGRSSNSFHEQMEKAGVVDDDLRQLGRHALFTHYDPRRRRCGSGVYRIAFPAAMVDCLRQAGISEIWGYVDESPSTLRNEIMDADYGDVFAALREPIAAYRREIDAQTKERLDRIAPALYLSSLIDGKLLPSSGMDDVFRERYISVTSALVRMARVTTDKNVTTRTPCDKSVSGLLVGFSAGRDEIEDYIAGLYGGIPTRHLQKMHWQLRRRADLPEHAHIDGLYQRLIFGKDVSLSLLRIEGVGHVHVHNEDKVQHWIARWLGIDTFVQRVAEFVDGLDEYIDPATGAFDWRFEHTLDMSDPDVVLQTVLDIFKAELRYGIVTAAKMHDAIRDEGVDDFATVCAKARVVYAELLDGDGN